MIEKSYLLRVKVQKDKKLLVDKGIYMFLLRINFFTKYTMQPTEFTGITIFYLRIKSSAFWAGYKSSS